MYKSGLRFVAHLIDRTPKKPSRKNQLKDAELQFRPVHSEGSRQVINPSRRSLSANSDTRCAEREPGSIQDSFGFNTRFFFANCNSFFFRSSYVIGFTSSQVDCVTFFNFSGHTKKILFRNSPPLNVRSPKRTWSTGLRGFSDDYWPALLWIDGRDFIGKTVVERRERLKQIITPGPESRSATTSRMAGSAFFISGRGKETKGVI